MTRIPKALKRLFSNEFPHNPGRWPFFYGWMIVVAGTVGVLLSIPGQTMGVSAFTEPLTQALSLERVDLTLAYLIGTTASAFLLPWAGRLYDRYGARAAGVLALLGLSAVLLYMSRLDWLLAFFEESALHGSLLAMVLVTLGFFGLRFSGQGLLTLVSRSMLAKWFNLKRGIVSAISGSFVTACFSSAPAGLHWLVSEYGAFGAWEQMAWVYLSFGVLFCWLFFRDKPEDSGLLMDGTAADQVVEETRPEFRIVKELTEPEALRTFAFWAFTLAFAFNGLVGTAIPFLAESLSLSLGMEAETLFHLFPYQGLSNILAGVVCGILVNRMRLKWLLIIMAGGQALGLAGLLLCPSLAGKVMFVVGNGMSWGFWGTLTIVQPARFYGRLHLGAINGRIMSALVLASAVGPYLFSYLQKQTGTYLAPIWLCLSVSIVLMLMAFKADNPQRSLNPE